MPSVRSRNFLDDRPANAYPAVSVELIAPSDAVESARDRRARLNPKKRGRPSEDEDQGSVAIAVYEAMRREATPTELSEEIGIGPRRARDLMLSAKERLASRIDEYVDAHLVATKVAAIEGDAKPAQWALENIEVDGVRAVDPPAKNAPPPAPTFNVGFVIGGMAAPVKQLPPSK